MDEILKRTKVELTEKLTGRYFIKITPPDVIEEARIHNNELPYIAISPLSTAREVESTLLIRPDHLMQITILDHYPFNEESIVGDNKTKGIIGHVNDIINNLEFSTLGIDGLAKGAIMVTNIQYKSLPREPHTFQIAILTVAVQGKLEKKS
jgi:hypothetical protein